MCGSVCGCVPHATVTKFDQVIMYFATLAVCDFWYSAHYGNLSHMPLKSPLLLSVLLYSVFMLVSKIDFY